VRILLLSPPIAPFRLGSVLLKTRCWQPYSLAIVAAGLEERGHSVELLDAHALGWSAQRTVEEVAARSYDALIYSSARHDAWELPTPSFEFIFEFFKNLEGRRNAEARFVIEGPHGTLEPARILQQIPYLDYVVRHEPEAPLLELFDAWGDEARIAAVGDLSWRDRSGEIHHNSDTKPLEDLDRLPMPAYHLLPMDRYREHGGNEERFAIVVTSRGCPMPCGYCFKEMFGAKLRFRSVAKVIEELQLLTSQYSVTRVYFHDQIFTLNRRRTHELLEAMIAAGLPAKLSWRCQTRLNGIKEDTLLLMRRAGCVEVQTGLESAAQAIQERLLKLDLEEFLKLRAFGERIGLLISPNNVIGLPGETLETAMESLRFYHRLGIPYAPNFHFPYPTTPFWRAARASGEIGDGSFEAIGERVGRVANALSDGDLATLHAECARWNRRLRWKQRLWRWRGRTFGSLVPERDRGARDPLRGTGAAAERAAR